MQTFLEEVAADIYSREKENLSECCLVFPGRRAQLFFSKYLSYHLPKPVWSPAFMTITELMMKLSGFLPADPLQLIFRLYEVYRGFVKEAENFDEFFLFGEILLNDFGDIDKNLVNANDLFKNLQSLKSIEDDYEYMNPEQIALIRSFWSNFLISKESDQKDEFIKVWQVLSPIYEQFRAILEQSGAVYEGMAYRKANELISGEGISHSEFRKIYFVGFNALTKSEKKLFSHLYNSGKAGFYWDYDDSYVKDKAHEAGFFMRENLKLFPDQRRSASHHFNKPVNEIEVISTSSDSAQAKIMGMKLEEWQNGGLCKENNTAVVLPDEFLLSAAMYSIPESFSDINITMGFPVRDTPVYSLVESLIDLQHGMKDQGADKEVLFYHKDVLKVLGHQYILVSGGSVIRKLRKDLIAQNRIFPSGEFLNIDELTALIFRKANSAVDLSAYLLEILHKLILLIPETENESGTGLSLQKEYIYHVYLAVNRLLDLISQEDIPIQPDTYRKLLRKIIRNMTIPFSGEPLKGLQLMGVLEARALDFENLIILSMNEGVFPGKSAGHSMIPYNLRKGFGLPTSEHQDRIYAYYFYRLIQRTKNLTLIYTTREEGVKKSEMSRFIYQLKYLGNTALSEKSLTSIVQQRDLRIIEVEKGEEEMEILKGYLPEGKGYLSPSGLNAFMDCSLKFYFRYIARLGEAEEVSEEIDPLLFGSIIHDALNILYEPYVGSGALTREEIGRLGKDKPGLRRLLNDSFDKLWLKTGKRRKSSNLLRGRNLIVREIMVNYLEYILQHDSRIAPFQILELETPAERFLDCSTGNSHLMVRMKGIIDRLDRVGEKIRVIDYKTGISKKDFKLVSDLFNRGDHKRRKEIFQTSMYCWLYESKENSGTLVPGIYDIRNMHSEKFSSAIRKDRVVLDDFSALREEFERELRKLVEDLFNPELSFQQVEDIEICKNCSYNKICAREDVSR